MVRGRNSKSSVLKDNARERKARDQAAGSLDEAVTVIQRWFTGEDETVKRLNELSGLILGGLVDYADQVRQ